jgi:predicted ATPase
VAARSENAPDWRERTSIPAGLWPAIEARLAMDTTAQEALRTLSLFAGPLPLPVALAVGGAALREALDRLQVHGLVTVQGDRDPRLCGVRHELIRRAVYERVSARLRPRLHREAALTLLEETPEFASSHPHVVASQFALAGEAELAAEHYFRAGGLAQERGAYATAEQHLAEAFALAVEDANAFQRIGQALVRIQMMTKGFSHDSVRETLARLAAVAAGGP